MFPRRYLRRSLLAVLLLPIILLGLFAIYQNRHVIFYKIPSHDHHHHHHHHNEDDSHISRNTLPNRKRQHSFQSKYLPNNSKISSKININDQQKIKNLLSNPQTIIPSYNAFNNNNDNNNQPIQNLNSLQQNSLLLNQKTVLAVIETKTLQNFVHLDLKGAAPKIVYYEKLFPYLKQLGANGILIEYEDMFPFTNNLSIIKHDLAYSKDDIKKILELAEQNNLKVMPLLQVYGHLEYVLKLKEFMHLREDKRYPQVITPCLEESYKLLFEMIDQMLLLHPLISYLHIGCDEVYYRLVHPQCINLHFRDDADLFIR